MSAVETIKAILAGHKLWLEGKSADEGAKCADLRGADLMGANLMGADLRCANLRCANLTDANLTDANLRGANLTGANLRGADLMDADLTDANLRDTNLTDADLRGANLRYADLRCANLRGANLTDANLTGANLTDANLTDADLRGADLRGVSAGGRGGLTVPWHSPDPSLAKRVAEAALAPGALDMRRWHSCETTHCLAGWAIVLSGSAGSAIEALTSPSVAGSILLPSASHLFYSTTKEALGWCREQLADGEVLS